MKAEVLFFKMVAETHYFKNVGENGFTTYVGI